MNPNTFLNFNGTLLTVEAVRKLIHNSQVPDFIHEESISDKLAFKKYQWLLENKAFNGTFEEYKGVSKTYCFCVKGPQVPECSPVPN